MLLLFFRLLRSLRALPLVLCALACAGCSVHPLGTNDLSIIYRVTGAEGGEKATPPATLASLVKARLGAAQITANVDTEGDGVKVTVDRDESGTVDALLSWRGGLSVDELAPSASFALPATDAKGLEVRTEKSASGAIDRYYVGPQDVLGRALRQVKLAPGTRVLLQRVDEDHSRSLLVRDPPRVDLSGAVASAVPDARTVIVRLSPYGAKNLEDATRALGGAPVVIARDRSVLSLAPLSASGSGSIVLSFGDDLAAYATARTMAALLASPALPPLTRGATTLVPPDWPLAVTALVVPFLLSLAWLFFVRRFDRAQPEPWWLVLATFLLGGLSVIPAAIAEIGWMHSSEWLDPSLVTMGGMLASLPLALPVFALVIGLSEEGSKFLGAWSLSFHRREFDEPIDGIIYGAASSLGFAAVENVKYFAVGRMTPALVVVRMFMSVPAHLFFGAIWGYALGRTLVTPKTRLFGYVALAALAHGAFDTLLSYGRLAWLAGILNLGMATLFVVLLRQSLRHGVVTRAVRLVDPNLRSLYAVGSPGGFMASVAALHVLALALFVASAFAVAEQTRVGLVFLLGMSSLVTLLGVAAYFLSATMPLDVVLDDYGVTFAGAARTWHSIRSLEPSPRGLHVRSKEGDIWIGPAAPAGIAEVARAIGQRMGSRRIAA